MLVWEVVFGVWVGWSERDKALLAHDARRAAPPRGAADARRVDAARRAQRRTCRSSARAGSGRGETLWALSNRGNDPFDGVVSLDGRTLRLELPPHGIAAVEPDGGVVVSEGGRSDAFPARPAVRVAAPVASSSPTLPAGMVDVPAPAAQTAVFRRRETGTYGEAPYVEEWKPLPPRLHDFVEVERPAGRGRFAIGVHEVARDGVPLTNVTLDEARAYAASVGARLPTEDEWQARGRRRACSSAPCRVSGTGRRASIATAGRGSRSSRAAPTTWRPAPSGTSTAAT